jgi:transcriptional regulator with XRE-family HTH domain
MSKAIDYFKANESPIQSRWREDAQWRRDNAFWLKYSRIIALRVLESMDEQSITQVQLAQRMGCSQQYVSTLLKGCSNMTLETIARLERALNLDILRSSLNYTSGYGTTLSSDRQQFLSEPDVSKNTTIERSESCVDGYRSDEG